MARAGFHASSSGVSTSRRASQMSAVISATARAPARRVKNEALAMGVATSASKMGNRVACVRTKKATKAMASFALSPATTTAMPRTSR